MPTYQDPDSKRWRYRFAYKGKRYGGTTPEGGNTKRIAEQLERDHIDRLAKGQDLPPAPTVAQFAVKFLEHQKQRLKPMTYRSEAFTMEKHVVPILGKLHLDEVDKKHIDMFVTKLRERGLEASTVNTYLAHLGALLSLAVEWKRIHTRPDIVMLKKPPKEIRFLSEDEAERLLSVATNPDWRSMVFVGLRTGLRVGELRGLRWSDLQLDREILTVNQTAAGVPGVAPHSPKSNKTRVVPLSPEAIAVLSERRKLRTGVGYVWSPAGRPHEWLSAGGSMSAMRRLAIKAGFVDERGKADIGWHTLRHTYASWLVMRGVPLRVVQKWMGHHSIVETERYAHLAPEFGHGGAALLDSPMLPRTLSLPSGDDEPT